jgi:hypothetical protein
MPLAPTAFRPATYFAERCARCHGPEGANYAEGFAARKTDAQLDQVIHDMAAGPGGAPLGPDEVAVLRLYHRAVGSGAPFLTSVDGSTYEGLADAVSGMKRTGDGVWSREAASSGKVILAERGGRRRLYLLP